MTQLIIGSAVLPQTSNDKYKCYPVKLEESGEAISGRAFSEVRGTVQKIEYAYDSLPEETYLAVLAALRAKPPITVTYLPDDSPTMVTGSFKCESLQPPSFAFALGGKALWHNLSFTLREVKPHD